MSQLQFPNKFPGKCCQCGVRQWTGTAVCIKVDVGFKIVCEQCDPNRFAQVYPEIIRQRQRDEEQRQRSEQEKALIDSLKAKLGIDFKAQTSVSYKQEAWCDVSEWTVPYTGEGTDEEFRKAVAGPRQNLYGNLRASQGVYLKSIDREAKRLTLSESVMLCD